MGYSSSFFEQNTGATTDQALTTGMTCLWEGRTSRQGGVAYEYRTAAWRRGPVFRIYMLNSYSVSSSALCAIAHWSGRSSIPEIAVLEPTGLWNTGFPACAGNDSGEDVKPHSRGAICTRVLRNITLLEREGAGNAGRWPHPQPRGQKRVGGPQANSPQVKPNDRHSLRNGFTAYSVLSPGYRAC
jgi:hypothetical protein